MIKGTSKRVIVVKQPDTDLFEEAYFIVKERKTGTKNDTKSLIQEAGRIINSENENPKKSSKSPMRERLTNLFFFLLGGLFAVLVFYMLINV